MRKNFLSILDAFSIPCFRFLSYCSLDQFLRCRFLGLYLRVCFCIWEFVSWNFATPKVSIVSRFCPSSKNVCSIVFVVASQRASNTTINAIIRKDWNTAENVSFCVYFALFFLKNALNINEKALCILEIFFNLAADYWAICQKVQFFDSRWASGIFLSWRNRSQLDSHGPAQLLVHLFVGYAVT